MQHADRVAVVGQHLVEPLVGVGRLVGGAAAQLDPAARAGRRGRGRSRSARAGPRRRRLTSLANGWRGQHGALVPAARHEEVAVALGALVRDAHLPGRLRARHPPAGAVHGGEERRPRVAVSAPSRITLCSPIVAPTKPCWPGNAGVQPLRTTHQSSPPWVSLQAKLWWLWTEKVAEVPRISSTRSTTTSRPAYAYSPASCIAAMYSWPSSESIGSSAGAASIPLAARAGELEVARRRLVAEAARAEVHADPDEALLVGEQVDVVVARADGPELVGGERRAARAAAPRRRRGSRRAPGGRPARRCGGRRRTRSARRSRPSPAAGRRRCPSRRRPVRTALFPHPMS